MPAQKSRSRSKSARSAEDRPSRNGGNGADPVLPEEGDGELTGRYIVTFRQGEEDAAVAMMSDSAGIAKAAIARASDFAEGVDADTLHDAETVFFNHLDIAVVRTPPDSAAALNLAAAGSESSPILAVEPERYIYIAQEFSLPYEEGPLVAAAPPPAGGGHDMMSYLRGYRDSAAHLYEQLSGNGVAGAAVEAGIAATFVDNAQLTWGLQATGVDRSRFSGRGIRVAVLDTGIDERHPDFAGRSLVTKSFVQGQGVRDGHGHGTHCAGTACGPLRPVEGRRYGIAHNAQLFVGKVLNNAGRGFEADGIAGIDWAVGNGCQVVSMSLGAQAPPSTAYEEAGRRALAAGTLVVAAAGNESERRLGSIQPVLRPANCVSVLAVGAVDRFMRIGDFSNRGSSSGGGKVDIAGPGVAVYSAWRMPQGNRTIDGTSMATPHVAGIAALWAEARNLTGAALWQLLNATARPLSISSFDVGSGLVQAP